MQYYVFHRDMPAVAYTRLQHLSVWFSEKTGRDIGNSGKSKTGGIVALVGFNCLQMALSWACHCEGENMYLGH